MGRSRISNDADTTDSVSEISVDGSSSQPERSTSRLRSSFTFNTFGSGKTGKNVTSGRNRRGVPSSLTRSTCFESTSHDGTARLTASFNTSDRKIDPDQLKKDAKSRYNIGIVYLQTGDCVKAQENLEHSLFCHIRLSGHDSRAYANDTIYDIAGVREKLGDCFVANTAIVDKFLAVDHYEESRRLLKCVHPEDAPDNLIEMLERVETKLKLPGLRNAGARRRPPDLRKTNAEGLARGLNGQSEKAVGDEPVAATDGNATGKREGRRKKLVKKMRDGIIDIIDDVYDDEASVKPNIKSSKKDDCIEATVMEHLKHDNHRTALNYLISLKDGEEMKSEKFRRQVADSMVNVAISAEEVHKINLATDAYEEARAIFKVDKHSGGNAKLAVRGCIKIKKLQAKEMEGVQDYDSAISYRSKVYRLLDEENRTVAACQQQVKIAYLHGAKGDYAKSIEALHVAIGRLHKGAKSVAYMASNRVKLLILCHEMQAICYVKSKKWNDAVDQYDEVLPLLLKKEGQGGKQYNSVLIHKSALLAMMGNYVMAAPTINKYLKNAEHSDQDLIVDGLDHALALDTNAATHLKLNNVGKAISVFERKLAFVKTLPNNNQMKSDTMHKLGCLLAKDNQLESALPLLDEALRTKKNVYDGKDKSVLETTWAVAVTNHLLGHNDKALEQYSILLANMSIIEDMPLNVVTIQHSAAKLLFEDGKVDKAVETFRLALRGAETSGNPQLKSEITLNLANALSGQEETHKAMELYDQLLNMKSLKKTKLSFMTRFNKCLLLVKMGHLDEAKMILHRIGENPLSMANDVRARVFLTLGNLALLNGSIDEPMDYFGRALDETADGDVSALVYTKKSIAMAQLDVGEPDKAISTLEEVLEDVSYSGVDGKSMNLLKAEIWNCMARVYKKKVDLRQTINFARLALQTYKTELGEKNPITLRNVTNLQLLLLEEAEELEDYDDAKSVTDAAKCELEDTLNVFESLDYPWTYRLDIATLKTNIGFLAVWEGNPKKARKLARQIEEIELPFEHSLVHRIAFLEERLEELEKTGGIRDADVEESQERSSRKSKGGRQRSSRKSKRR